MKRELKFRAWDERNKIMHYDFQFIKSDDSMFGWIVFTSDKQKLNDKPHPFENPFFQHQFKIMQFTGLTARNGIGIYEGDIVSEDGKNWEIIFEYACFGAKTSEYELVTSSTAWEVIGNIYENPELLK